MKEFGVNRESMVKEFHDAVGVLEGVWSSPVLLLRGKLIREEFLEVLNAFADVDYIDTPENREALLKELADLQYVLSGTCVALGLDMEEAFARVHESNMSKFGDDGKPIYREDGKVLKGPNYKEPDLGDLV